MLKYRDITEKDYKFLYEMLSERDDTINISHRAIPSYGVHCDYWCSKSNRFKEAMIIMEGRSRIGYYYVTLSNEIGIFIKNEHQGKGYGKSTISHIIGRFPGVELLANINPKNKISQKLFKKFGFGLIQYTFRRNLV